VVQAIAFRGLFSPAPIQSQTTENDRLRHLLPLKKRLLRPPRTLHLTIKQMVDSGRHLVVLDLAIESLRKSGKLRFRVQGTSMMPTIRPGTCVSVRQATPDQVAGGDIILLKTSTGLRLHRVVEIRPGSSGPMFVTRGDNHRHNDQPASAADLLGRWDGAILDESVPRTRRFARFVLGLRA